MDELRDAEDARIFRQRNRSKRGLDDRTPSGHRISRNRRPNKEFFHAGRKGVIYDSKRRTVPVYGVFRSEVYELGEPEYGCHLAVRFQAFGVVRDSNDAPSLQDVLPGFDVKQKSYRRLERDEYEALVASIERSPGFESISR